MRELVARALEELPPEPEPNQVAVWIRSNHGIDIDPRSVGIYARDLGYTSQVVFLDGKAHRILKKTS